MPCHWIQVDLNLTCAQAMSLPFTLCALEHRLAVAHGTFEDVVNAVGGRDGTHSCVLPVCVFQCARVCCARMRVHITEQFCVALYQLGKEYLATVRLTWLRRRCTRTCVGVPLVAHFLAT